MNKLIVSISVSLLFLLTAPQAVLTSVPAPILVSPVPNAVNISTAPTLSWNPVSGATLYQVVVSRWESGSEVIILAQDTSNTSLLVQRPFVTTPQRRDLIYSQQYWWKVRVVQFNGMNVTGPWSASRAFTTKRRNVWSPWRHELVVQRVISTNQDEKIFYGRWDAEAVNWIRNEQRLDFLHGRQLWWEHEINSPGLTTNFFAGVVAGTFWTDLPTPAGWEYETGGEQQIALQTRRPEEVVVNYRYTAMVRLHHAPNRPSSVWVNVESELTDWSVNRPWWDPWEFRPFIPGSHFEETP